MKRILVVLALLALCSMGFSVSGKVYGRLLPSTWGGGTSPDKNGATSDKNTAYWYAGENYWGIPLDDLRVGRQGTGVSVNFDTFTLDYKLRASLDGNGVDLLKSSANVISATGNGALSATSPGYFQISGIKAGPLDLGIGASWWTLGQTYSAADSNAGYTNNYTVGYNLVALDLQYNFQVGDIRFHADPWNKADFYFWGGSEAGTTMAATNAATVGGYSVFIPLNIDYSMEAFSLTIESKFGFSGNSSTYTLNSGVTNATANSAYQAGAVAKIGYVINELFGVFAGVGIEVNGNSLASYSNGVVGWTNTSTHSEVFMPLQGGLILTPSPALTFNLGLGYNLVVSDKTTTIVGSTVQVTNNSYQDSRFQSEWDTYEMHGYYHPLIKFAANTKFAGDFSAGLVYIVMLNDPAGAGDNGGYKDQNSHTDTGYSKLGNWLNFVNLPDFDAYGGSSAYIGYAKDNFEVKAWFGNETQLAGLFSAIDFAIKY